ncbi:hypothetical protein vseg_015645 [Gypsophila vaccaria]
MVFKASIFVLVCVLVAVKATAFKEEMVYASQPPLKPPCDHATPPAQSSPANATSPPTPAEAPTSTPVYPTPQAPQSPSSAPTVYPTPQAPSSAPTAAPTYPTPPIVVPGVPANHNHLSNIAILVSHYTLANFTFIVSKNLNQKSKQNDCT